MEKHTKELMTCSDYVPPTNTPDHRITIRRTKLPNGEWETTITGIPALGDGYARFTTPGWPVIEYDHS